MSTGKNLKKARKEKDDEFYTRYEDIEKECMRYRDQFHGKTILCNCDDPEWSNFWQFFHRNFSFFQLKKLISTHYVKEGASFAQIYDGTRDKKIPLTRDEKIDNNEDMNLFDLCNFEESNGDFRSPECIKYLEEADIVVTNPPFSLFREFIGKLVEYDKKFLVIGNMNAITYKECFSLIKNNKMWIGYNGLGTFMGPNGETKGACQCWWFTNLANNRRNEELMLYKEYNEEEYPHYDNYNAINVNKTAEIPCDYFGYMGVPIRIVEHYNPEQFEILGIMNTGEENKGIRYENTPHGRPVVNGKEFYLRYIIRRKYDNEGRLVHDFYDEDGNLIK